MAKLTSLDAQLAHLRALKSRAPSDLTDADLLPLLASRHSYAAAPAAELTGKAGRASLVPALLAAYDRFAADGEKVDKGCLAKLAVVNALCALDHRDTAVYLRAVRTRQFEPAMGRTIDTAGELRGRAAEALVVCLHPGAVVEVAPLLVDSDPQCRVGAVRAAGRAPGDAGEALLRLKLAAGDAEPVVVGEAAAALLAIDAGRNAPYVAGLLTPPGSEAAQAALAALVDSKSSAALAALKKLYDDAPGAATRQAALGALALLRVDGAHEFLLDLVRNALHPRAREVVAALVPLKADPRFRTRLAKVLDARDDKLLARYADETLGAC